MCESVTHEVVESSIFFPFVNQEEWHLKWTDGKEELNFNLTQIPLDVEVGDHGFALDYHTSIHFEIERSEFDRDVIFNLTFW